MYFSINSSAKAIYFSSASSWEVPFNSVQASHLYLPFKSKKPGFGVVLSPTVACLNKPYKFNNSSSVGFLVKFLTFSA